MPGWLAFVIVAFAIGNAAGMVTLKAGEGENGQSRQADQILSQQYPRARAKEEVLVESQSGRLPVAEYRRAVTEMVSRLSHTPAWPASGRRWRPATRVRSRRTATLHC